MAIRANPVQLAVESVPFEISSDPMEKVDSINRKISNLYPRAELVKIVIGIANAILTAVGIYYVSMSLFLFVPWLHIPVFILMTATAVKMIYDSIKNYKEFTALTKEVCEFPERLHYNKIVYLKRLVSEILSEHEPLIPLCLNDDDEIEIKTRCECDYKKSGGEINGFSITKLKLVEEGTHPFVDEEMFRQKYRPWIDLMLFVEKLPLNEEIKDEINYAIRNLLLFPTFKDRHPEDKRKAANDNPIIPRFSYDYDDHKGQESIQVFLMNETNTFQTPDDLQKFLLRYS